MRHSTITPTLILCSAMLGGLCLFPTGCSVLQPKADLTEFYVLRSPSAVSGVRAPAGGSPLEIRVGPGNVAEYLNATPIAVEEGVNRLRYLDRHHWAEPLSKAIGRTLAGELAARLDPARVTVYPEPTAGAASLEVRYSVTRFEGQLDGPVTLEVSWRVLQMPAATVVAEHRSVYVVPPAAGKQEVGEYVERMAVAVSQWSNDIADAIHNRQTP